MEIRSAAANDMLLIEEIDAVIESTHYLHVDRAGAGLDLRWSLSERPLRQKLVTGNLLSDDNAFALKQIASGADEGLAVLIEHAGAPIAFALAQQDFTANTLRLMDLRVDHAFRRQGMGSALVYRAIEEARRLEVRAISATSLTNNYPAAQCLLKLGFQLAGLDERRTSNHDLVKEAVTLFWYLPLD